MIATLAVSGYRSLCNLVLPLGRLNLVTGPNGAGKSNLYRALRLLAETAQGRLVPSLAREGGLQSVLWAGPETIARSVVQGDHPVQGTARRKPISLRLGFATDELGYAVDLGLPPQTRESRSLFLQDPEIKRESIWAGPVLRPGVVLVDRRGPVVKIPAHGRDPVILAGQLSTFDSMMTECADPRGVPEMLTLRDEMRSWRFYDQMRTDVSAPARQPQVGTHTPVLGPDGADLAAALQTILEIGDAPALAAAVDDAFPRASVSVMNTDGWFELLMHQHGLLRPLRGAELSDGTLRYLIWVAALLTPRPPALLVLNEPETSLHPDLLPALGRLVAAAAERSQVIVVSHAASLVDALQTRPECQSIVLTKVFGETKVEGQSEFMGPRWQWPVR